MHIRLKLWYPDTCSLCIEKLAIFSERRIVREDHYYGCHPSIAPQEFPHKISTQIAQYSRT